MERNGNGAPSRDTEQSRGLGALDGFFENGTGGREGCSRSDGTMSQTMLEDLPLAYAYVPMQRWRMLYAPQDALAAGTLFEELNKPLGVYGNE